MGEPHQSDMVRDVKADLDAADRFSSLLAGEGPVTFQTFDDDEERKDPKLARILHGTLHTRADELGCLNEQGAGVFMMVNEGDLKGRKAGNVVRVRAVFVDLDGAPVEPVVEAVPEPHIIVESSPGRFHAYWVVNDVPLDRFSFIQKALARRYGADSSVSDLCRVMRVPGFWHRKGEPFITRLVCP